MKRYLRIHPFNRFFFDKKENCLYQYLYGIKFPHSLFNVLKQKKGSLSKFMLR